MAKLTDLAKIGQAVWLDYIQRSFTRSGKLQERIDQGVCGVTSNPTIFDKAIRQSEDYDDQIHKLVGQDKSVVEIYEALVLTDIREAADLFAPVYEQTGGLDGYVSLEVDPNLAYDTATTIAEAKRLFAEVDRPNVMIKIPATHQGIPAVEAVIAAGINVNVTLIFSIVQYEATAAAYLAGLEQRLALGKPIDRVASVASFFISRVDTVVDAELEKRGDVECQGKIAVDNARLAQVRFREIFTSDRWMQLKSLSESSQGGPCGQDDIEGPSGFQPDTKDAGAQVQRQLWASTSTKNPDYPDTLYVDSFIGPNTVNTLPPATLEAFLDHGQAESTLGEDLEAARLRMRKLGELGISFDPIAEQLLYDGVGLFCQSYKSLLESIEAKRSKLLAKSTK